MAKNTLTVEVNGAKSKLLMTFGLLNELVHIIGDGASLATAAIDNEVRTKVLVAVLRKRGKTGVIEGEIDLDVVDISFEDVFAICEWASEHVIDFFIKATEQTTKLGSKFEDPLRSLTQSPAGSSGSASTKEPVGPSTPSQAG